MTEVTPRPWHIPPGPWWQDPNDNRIHDAAGNDVLDYLPVTEIGKRVNSHDALVAACEAMRDCGMFDLRWEGAIAYEEEAALVMAALEAAK
jgi:hypothetical protein